VADVQREAEAFGELGGEAVHQFGGHFHDDPALVADQVDVLVLTGRVGGRAVAEVGVAHEADAVEQVERAVDRRDVHRRGRALDLHADLLRRRVVEGPHSVQHELALRCHPQAALVQRVPQRGIHDLDPRRALLTAPLLR